MKTEALKSCAVVIHELRFSFVSFRNFVEQPRGLFPATQKPLKIAGSDGKEKQGSGTQGSIGYWYPIEQRYAISGNAFLSG